MSSLTLDPSPLELKWKRQSSMGEGGRRFRVWWKRRSWVATARFTNNRLQARAALIAVSLRSFRKVWFAAERPIDLSQGIHPLDIPWRDNGHTEFVAERRPMLILLTVPKL